MATDKGICAPDGSCINATFEVMFPLTFFADETLRAENTDPCGVFLFITPCIGIHAGGRMGLIYIPAVCTLSYVEWFRRGDSFGCTRPLDDAGMSSTGDARDISDKRSNEFSLALCLLWNLYQCAVALFRFL